MEKVCILVVEPYSKPQIRYIDKDNSLEEMQSIVDGYIESVPIFNGVDIFVNEEGKLMNLPVNRLILHNGNIIDMLVGNIIISASDDEGEIVSLQDYQINEMTKIFYDNAIEI
jgi:hypothetical protein